MNKFLFTAVALTAASSTAVANNGDWLELDQDIASLSSTVATADGATLGGLIRTSYRDAGTMGGFVQEDIDLWAQGSLEEFSWRVSFDMDTGSAVLEDAYVAWSYDSGITVLFGQFKAPVLRSAVIDPENLQFIDRSNLGAVHDFWDTGVGVLGEIQEGLSYVFAVRDGYGPGVVWGDDSEELFWFGHMSYDIGNGLSPIEGAMKSGEELDAVIGISWWDMEDDSLDPVLAADVAVTMGQISGSFELADAGDDADNILAPLAGMGTNPVALTLGYLFADNMEAAYRYEDYDDSADSSKSTFGLNWYMHGHNAKWQINYIDDDFATDETIAVGLTVGASR